MVGGALPLCLYQDNQVLEVLSVPGRKGFQELETFALRIDDNLDVIGIRGWGQVAALPFLEAPPGKLFSRGRLELHLFASLIDQRVAEWIKRQPPARRARSWRVSVLSRG